LRASARVFCRAPDPLQIALVWHSSSHFSTIPFRVSLPSNENAIFIGKSSDFLRETTGLASNGPKIRLLDWKISQKGPVAVQPSNANS
jgi:hypothetical protein